MACHRLPLALSLLAMAASLAGCEDGGSSAVFFDLEIVRAGGSDPLAGSDVERVRIDVREGDGEVQTLEADVGEGGTFDLRQAVGDTGAPLAIRVALTGPEPPLVGAPPPFAAVETVPLGQLVRIPVGPAGSCEQLDGVSLAAGREQAGVARLGTFALVAGGIEAEGPSRRAGFVDLLGPGAGTFDDRSDPLGASRAAAMTGDVALVVPSQGTPLRFDLSVEEMRGTPAPLHDGAGDASAVVARREPGAAVIGGRAGGDRVDAVSWVGAEGSVVTTRLSTPRAEPAAVAFAGDAVLVAGGMAEGEPLVELVRPEEATGRVVLEAPDHGVRDSAHLVLDAGGTRALLLGGVDGTGAARTDTLRLDGCPSPCEVTAGPEWAEARTGVATVPDPEGGAWLVGGEGPSGRVDRVTWSGGGADIGLATMLAAGRDSPGAFFVQGGVLWVVGGRGSGGPRRDVELCFPPTLRGP